ncbi:SDR family NAD(P)-dependent oxidoreductase [Jeongeupia naejangsanensis]|uniref:SDR family oxidoreductase n=1 Tax=Jeongeupia naejangsanensis TaxID=613195 RepID=A0ABS2BQF3_9NEIS|nr:SDR family oxidoreductase [Jeongeupia naejangsanensis]MBM3117869.1 SDR family oxidoreductase [Jeongeupia naejangsanensis]
MNKPVVLITGALTGIGRATAIAFAREGARLIVSGRRDAAGAALVAELHALDAEAEYVHADVRNEADVQQLVARAVARFGRLDVAVNNAGVEGESGPLTGQTVDNYEATFRTNVLGVLLAMKHELAVMLPQGSGAIVNLSSIVGQVGMAGASVYVASKFAVEGLTKSAALEAAPHGVTVNAVAPGPVRTEMFERFTGNDAAVQTGMLASLPNPRAADADEIAQTIVFLASGKVRYLNGQSVAVDGGYTAR